MEILFLGLIIFLFILAVFDLSVGVSNDAVNFLSSAVGAKAASFMRVLIVASIGVFIGAVMSNGMMDIARHGIFRPENLSFYDVTVIFMTVMVTDIILLDIFNSIGMPTSTTVSLVFELLGATFVVALFKMADPGNVLGLGAFLNAEKALSVILGIFLSVAIAFIFGSIVQFIARLVFTFEYKSKLKWKVGIFGGIACTAIIYFMLFKGIKDLSFMTTDLKDWINNNIILILGASMIFFSVMMQILYLCKVNVFKTVVLLGTFSLAMAFAGNDLVNFIGVPLTALDSYLQYSGAGGGDPRAFMMDGLNSSARTPFYFLIGAGTVMVVSLATSGKARQVTKTTIGLSAQGEGDELFGSSRLSRSIVRFALKIHSFISARTPDGVKRWVAHRMDTSVQQQEDGAAFDLIRGSVNLMLAGMLIALGTSMKLPLSTTFVTFMVAMGTSLADKAWGRDSAVFRITGVISVIGGWFITAGIAFIGAGIVVSLMHLGGIPVMIAGGVIAIIVLVRSNIRFKNRKKDTQEGDTLFQTIIRTDDPQEVWGLSKIYINDKVKEFLAFGANVYSEVVGGFIDDNYRALSKAEKSLVTEKEVLKHQRRRMTMCLRKISPSIAMEKSTWFHLEYSMAVSITYSLRRITEVCKEHVDNNFRPLPSTFHQFLTKEKEEIASIFLLFRASVDDNRFETIDELRHRCDAIKRSLSNHSREVYDCLQNGDAAEMTVVYVYLNLLQESQEMITSLRKMLRASGKLNLEPSHYRSFSTASRDILT